MNDIDNEAPRSKLRGILAEFFRSNKPSFAKATEGFSSPSSPQQAAGYSAKENKKILIVINNLGVGGAERVVVNDLNEMLRQGVSVRLLTLKNESSFSLFLDCAIEKKYWQIINFGSLFNIVSWIKVFVYIKQEKPDIPITHLWFSNTIGRVFKTNRASRQQVF